MTSRHVALYDIRMITEDARLAPYAATLAGMVANPILPSLRNRELLFILHVSALSTIVGSALLLLLGRIHRSPGGNLGESPALSAPCRWA